MNDLFSNKAGPRFPLHVLVATASAENYVYAPFYVLFSAVPECVSWRFVLTLATGRGRPDPD